MRIWGMILFMARKLRQVIQNQSWVRISRCQVNCLKELYRNSVRSRLRPMPWPARLLHLFKVQLCHPSRKLPRIGGCKKITNQNDRRLKRIKCILTLSHVSLSISSCWFLESIDLEVMPAKALGVGEGLVLHLDMLALWCQECLK